MRLRTAIKIKRMYEEPINRNGRLRYKGIKWPYSRKQYVKSAIICKRHLMDGRIPYIPTNRELEERAEIQICLLADLLIDDPECEDFKEQALLELERNRVKK